MPPAGIDVPPIRSFRVGAMGSASLFERLEACLAEERAELETCRSVSKGFKVFLLFSVCFCETEIDNVA